ncbi:hypothetical protein [Embleya hyalina]|uniref:Uncharacterized protein n=1 Tax=Embleya hyalina TaxID=516124 RepID=A0A401YYN9_9ACTN|nr:hypothetical protein [Embleya hyalina]GCD99660.1 hypothetical protein EHYA_07382 [Embleya hyalina]
MHVFFQPAALSQKSVRRHYDATIARRVSFLDHERVIPGKAFRELSVSFPDGEACVWGVTPGQRGVNVSKARRIAKGDLAFFTGDKVAYLSGIVSAVWHSTPFAERLWGRDQLGQTWEWMYALDDVREHDILMDEVRAALGWKDTRNVQNLTLLVEDQGATMRALREARPGSSLSAALPAASGPDVAPSPARVVSAAVPGAGADVPAPSAGRITTGTCALCRGEVPDGFLVVAAIKTRGCSPQERGDPANVIALCTLGCESLFRLGYVAVDGGGIVVTSPQALEVPALRVHVERLALTGCEIAYRSLATAGYLAWHHARVFRDTAPLRLFET